MQNKVQLLTVPGKWDLTYNYSAGETISRFLNELRDKGKIIATKCWQCNRVLLPPRSFCERCFVPIKDNWVELSPKGTLEAFTIVTSKFEGLPDPPYVICYIKLEGADTSFPHFLTGIDLSDTDKARQKIKVGMSVHLVFKDRGKREGRMSDFRVEPA
jgi:uncharacterized OB-fold protein